MTIGGKAWSAFDAAEETIEVAPAQLTAAMLAALQDVVAEWD